MTQREPEPITIRKQIFLSEAEVKYRIPVNRIREVLSQEFGEFSPMRIPEYEERLAYISSQTQAPINPPSYDHFTFIPDQKCPMCGSRIYSDPVWNDRMHKIPGWRCESGGLLHYLQWRANKMMARRGQVPCFQEVESVGSS